MSQPDPSAERMVEYLKEKNESNSLEFPPFNIWLRNKVGQEMSEGTGYGVPNFPEISSGTEMAILHKTVYDSYVEQGFHPAQALYLTAAMMSGNPGIAPDLDADS